MKELHTSSSKTTASIILRYPEVHIYSTHINGERSCSQVKAKLRNVSTKIKSNDGFKQTLFFESPKSYLSMTILYFLLSDFSNTVKVYTNLIKW